MPGVIAIDANVGTSADDISALDKSDTRERTLDESAIADGDDGDSTGTDGDDATAVVGAINCDAGAGVNCGDVRVGAANYCGVAIVKMDLFAAGWLETIWLGVIIIRLAPLFG